MYYSVNYNIENWVWTRTLAALCCINALLLHRMMAILSRHALCGHRNPISHCDRGCFTSNHPTILASRKLGLQEWANKVHIQGCRSRIFLTFPAPASTPNSKTCYFLRNRLFSSQQTALKVYNWRFTEVNFKFSIIGSYCWKQLTNNGELRVCYILWYGLDPHYGRPRFGSACHYVSSVNRQLKSNFR